MAEVEDMTSRFELRRMIGEGSFGKVFKAVSLADGCEVAVKIVSLEKMDPMNIQNTLNEIRFLKSVKHLNIVGYHEAFFDELENNLWIVTEFMGGGDLSEAIALAKRDERTFPEISIWLYFIQALRGLESLNRLGIIHRDIKPANIFLGDDLATLKLGDFNIAKAITSGFARTQIGSPSYIAPEMWQGFDYSVNCDVWSLGVCMFELISLRLPFEARSMPELKARVLNDPVPSLPSHISSELSDVIMKCLTKDPKKRLTAAQLLLTQEIMARSKQLQMPMSNEASGLLEKTIHLPSDLAQLNIELKLRNSPSVKREPKRGADVSKSNSASRTSEHRRQVSKKLPLPITQSGERAAQIHKMMTLSKQKRGSAGLSANEPKTASSIQLTQHKRISYPNYQNSKLVPVPVGMSGSLVRSTNVHSNCKALTSVSPERKKKSFCSLNCNKKDLPNIQDYVLAFRARGYQSQGAETLGQPTLVSPTLTPTIRRNSTPETKPCISRSRNMSACSSSIAKQVGFLSSAQRTLTKQAAPTAKSPCSVTKTQQTLKKNVRARGIGLN